jgi:hypothetical protein
MTLDEYREAMAKIPWGPWGPLVGLPAYRISVPHRPAAARPGPPRRVGTADDARISEKLERHRKDAEHDRIVRRLRARR